MISAMCPWPRLYLPFAASLVLAFSGCSILPETGEAGLPADGDAAEALPTTGGAKDRKGEAGTSGTDEQKALGSEPAAAPAASLPREFPKGEWVSLFDGKTLHGWKPFKDEEYPDMYGKVEVADGSLVLDAGGPMTGVSWQGEIPRDNYEVEVEAMRAKGSDFFCGLTFPVGESYLTWINGGWGGTVVGLSNIDNYSAVENETTNSVDFKNGQWYKLQLRVLRERIEASIDGDKLIDLERKDRQFSIWLEQELCKPFGITTYDTRGVLRSIKVKALAAP